jgi:hypothetical protein
MDVSRWDLREMNEENQGKRLEIGRENQGKRLKLLKKGPCDIPKIWS